MGRQKKRGWSKINIAVRNGCQCVKGSPYKCEAKIHICSCIRKDVKFCLFPGHFTNPVGYEIPIPPEFIDGVAGPELVDVAVPPS